MSPRRAARDPGAIRAIATLLVLACGSASAEPLRGRLSDHAGAPVAGAAVRVVPLDVAWTPRPQHGGSLPGDVVFGEAPTSEDGAFALESAEIPAGLHALLVQAPGVPPLLRHRERIRFGGAPLPQDLDVALPELVTARGLALDDKGAPAPRIPLTAWSIGQDGVAVIRAETDERGRFTLAVPRGASLTLIGRSPERFGIARMPVPASGDVVLALHLDRFETVDGHAILAATGAPAEGVRLRALLPSWDPIAPTGAEAAQEPWGDAEQVADVILGPGGRYSVRLPPQGMLLATGPDTMAMRLGRGRLRVLPGTSLRGSVRDPAGGVADADVRWTELPGGVKTDSAGRFQLLPDVNAAVRVTTREGATLVVPDPAPTATLLVPASRRLRVLASVRGEDGTDVPVAGATVRYRADAWDVITATGADGSAELPMRGRVRVEASSDGLRAAATARPDETLVRLQLGSAREQREPAPPRPIRVSCVGVDGRPLEGAIARAVPAGLPPPPGDDRVPATAATGSAGLALLQAHQAVPHGVLVTRPGLAPQWIPDVLPGSSVTARLPAGVTVRVVVRDESGEPVPGAGIAVTEESVPLRGFLSAGARRSASSDATGSAELRDLAAGSLLVQVVADGHASPPPERVSATAGQSLSMAFVLPAGATLRGLVRDPAGPVAGARVDAELQDPTAQRFMPGLDSLPRSGFTAEDGTFEIGGLRGEAWYSVSATAEWHAPAHAGARPSESRLEIEMIATGRIEGSVQGDSTLESVTCRRIDPDREEPESPKDRETLHASGYSDILGGSFLVEPLLPGRYECEATGPVHAARAEGLLVRAGAATSVTLVPRTRPSVLVTVLDAESGAPVAGASVMSARTEQATDEDGSARVPLWSPGVPGDVDREDDEDVDPDGELPADGRPPRPHDADVLLVVAEGYRPSRTAIPAPPPSALTVRLVTLAEVAGRVVDAASAPAPFVMVRADGMGDPVVADADGRFRMRVPDEGGEIVAWRSSASGLEEARVSLEAGVPPPSELLLMLQRVETCELIVTVQDASGPVAGASVIVSGDGMSLGVTDRDGRWTATGLRAGPARLIVEAPAGQAQRTVRLTAGEPQRETVVLGLGWTLEGRAVRAGQPIEGAFVRAMDDYEARDVSHVDGSFRLRGLPEESDTVRIVVSDPETGVHRTVEARRGGGVLTVDLTAVALTGRVVAAGRPVESAFVMIDCDGQRDAAEAGADGRFLLEGLAPDRECDLLVTTAAEEMPSLPLRVTTPPEGRLDLGDLTMQSSLLQGWIEPAPGMQEGLVFGLATAEGLPAGTRRVRPDAEGRFSLLVPPGPLEVLATCELCDGLGAVLVPAQAGTPLQLALPPEAVLELEITGALPALAWARVVAWNEHPEGHPLVPTAAAGLEEGSRVIRLGGLPAGRVIVEVGIDEREIRLTADVVAGSVVRRSVAAN